jgi:hypothetical protein
MRPENAATPAPAETGNGRQNERLGQQLDSLDNNRSERAQVCCDESVTITAAANYIKAVLDTVHGVVLIDDSLVVEIMAIKRFAIDPKIVLTITPLPALASNRTAS